LLPGRLAAGAVLMRANIVPFERPDRLFRAVHALLPWGVSIPGTVAAAAARYPNAVAIVDEDGPMRYEQLWSQSRALAEGLRRRGVHEGTTVGILGRNHRGFVLAMVASATCGADIVLLNTGFAGPQLADVTSSEHLDVIIHDDDFTDIVKSSGVAQTIDERSLALLSAQEVPAITRPPSRPGALVVLTSGTTGRPKGAARRASGAQEGVAALLGRIPLRARGTTLDAAPLFHAWGLSHLIIALSLSSTVLLQRRFDPQRVLRVIAANRADALVVVPVMLQRILELGPDALVHHDTSSLRVIAASGSALGGKLATDVLHRFGPVLYNVYGSTEVATATVATPADLQAAPTTAGRVAPGARVEILDRENEPLGAGAIGRIFVGNPMRFEGYTNGKTKETQRGMLSSGDLGHFDEAGRLYIDGREDDMIVSGGENVFPREVEELLTHHPAIADVAVIGVDDDEFGNALKAVVVRRDGTDIDGDAVKRYVHDHLARYKVPRQVVFTDELPRSPTGKIDRKRLP
jgi:fatty-acyl-CoA synthase